SMQCAVTASFVSCNGNNHYFYNETSEATWSSGNTSIVTMDSTTQGLMHAIASGSAAISASYKGNTYKFYPTPQPHCTIGTTTISPRLPVDVDSLVFTITSGGAPNDSQGVISGQAANVQIQAKGASTGVTPDPNFNDQNVQFSLMSINTSVGEKAPSSVNFASGTANASVTIVQASGLINSTRQIVVGPPAPPSAFFPYVYMNVIATDEGNVNQITACNYKIPANAQMVALPYGQALCGQQVLVVNGSAEQEAPALDVGPWCPNPTPIPGNPCVCSADAYWDGTGVPYAATHSCSSNGAGIDLGDGTYSTVRGGTNGPVDWKFP
ncbi:MAG: hypothetical protein ACRDFX_11315, partial [Chloroflexota bacterium]